MDRHQLCHLHRSSHASVLRFLRIRIFLPYRSRRLGVKQGGFLHPLPLVFLLCLYIVDRHGARPFQLFHVHLAVRSLRGYRQGKEEKANGNHANMVFLFHHGRSVAQQWFEGFHVISNTKMNPTVVIGLNVNHKFIKLFENNTLVNVFLDMMHSNDSYKK